MLGHHAVPRSPQSFPLAFAATFYLEDTHRTDFFAITAPPQPNFSLRHTTDFRLACSRRQRR
jgi:hypothetical protein